VTPDNVAELLQRRRMVGKQSEDADPSPTVSRLMQRRLLADQLIRWEHWQG